MTKDREQMKEFVDNFDFTLEKQLMDEIAARYDFDIDKFNAYDKKTYQALMRRLKLYMENLIGYYYPIVVCWDTMIIEDDDEVKDTYAH